MIRVHNLEVTYAGGIRALAPATLSFEIGAFTVLLGPSGAGKSTLLRALNGLVAPTAGRIIAPGLATPDVGDLNDRRSMRAHRRRTGMVFQQHQLIGRLSVLVNVLIERVGLIDDALRRADDLSGGQQQRVGIARALVQQPTIMLADEPVASLDPATADRVLALLHGICKADRITAIVSLHQLEFARRYADRIVGLARGEVVFDGPPAKLGRPEITRIYGISADDGANPELQRKTGTYA